jgi:hypothetical protein
VGKRQGSLMMEATGYSETLYTSTRLYGVISLKMTIFIVTVVSICNVNKPTF